MQTIIAGQLVHLLNSGIQQLVDVYRWLLIHHPRVQLTPILHIPHVLPVSGGIQRQAAASQSLLLDIAATISAIAGRHLPVVLRIAVALIRHIRPRLTPIHHIQHPLTLIRRHLRVRQASIGIWRQILV